MLVVICGVIAEITFVSGGTAAIGIGIAFVLSLPLGWGIAMIGAVVMSNAQRRREKSENNAPST